MNEGKPVNLEAETLFQMISVRYGDRLDAEQLEEVRKGVETIAEAAQALRAVKLENGDEPLSIFTPYRAEG